MLGFIGYVGSTLWEHPDQVYFANAFLRTNYSQISQISKNSAPRYKDPSPLRHEILAHWKGKECTLSAWSKVCYNF